MDPCQTGSHLQCWPLLVSEELAKRDSSNIAEVGAVVSGRGGHYRHRVTVCGIRSSQQQLAYVKMRLLKS